jgi:hypothetical protein
MIPTVLKTGIVALLCMEWTFFDFESNSKTVFIHIKIVFKTVEALQAPRQWLK